MKSKRSVQNEKWHSLYTGLASAACFERFLNGCFTLELTPVLYWACTGANGAHRGVLLARMGIYCQSGKEVLNGLFSFAWFWLWWWKIFLWLYQIIIIWYICEKENTKSLWQKLFMCIYFTRRRIIILAAFQPSSTYWRRQKSGLPKAAFCMLDWRMVAARLPNGRWLSSRT